VIDHIGMPVSDIARATAFYLKALAPLGISIVMEVSAEETGAGAAVGFGSDGKPIFWIGEAPGLVGGHGPPGLRPHYHANYYGAFVLDPDGNNIEAVCHAPA
jgi:catechol 2,3-dioxygenase-like lactoylglutathione lyase family enzyme